MELKLHILEGGYCTHKEKMVIKGGRNETVKFPSMFALIIHPKHGVILYDTGYTKRFYKETSNFPFSIYAKMTPVYVKEEDTAVYKLGKLGIKPEEVNYIIISHFHADHIAALNDFPKSKFICMSDGYDKVKNLKGFGALKAGYLKGLLPSDFESRTIFLDQKKPNYQIDPVYPFDYAFDYFGDESLKFIPLEGHYKGHLGLLTKSETKNDFFFIADSCWLSKSYKENIMPHTMAGLIMDNQKEYKRTLNRIHSFYNKHPKINIIPSHCNEVFNMFVEKSL